MKSKFEASPSISLVLIVRDEAQNIAKILNELKPVYDEAIVVDTGSTDGTVALAVAAGAQVIHFPWCDDFAAARNHGIDAAGGDWILTVDADECIAAEDFSALRQAVANGAGKAFFFTQRNYSNLVGHPEWRFVDGKYPGQEEKSRGFIKAFQIRLFPNLKELRYHGCIHETIGGCTQAGIEKEYLEITIHHFGHLQTGAVAQRRSDLYSRLTREKFRRNPNDAGACLQMGIRFLEEGHGDKAKKILERLIDLELPDHPATTRGNLALGGILQKEGQPAAAIEKFELAVQQRPQWLTCWMEVISALAEAGRWTDLARYLKAAETLFPQEALLWRFECRLLIATGQYQAAATRADELVERYPDWQGARRLAEICQELVEKNL